ncbi:hypothetical protein HHI36_023132 [Cryptolaemus montrouzieri]|uniref:Uncharacterized protein n=1 Tax=Cryptolaemus montrouzieri TaxID=559131 RepID=A0ABD2PG42_9CUCU
MNRDGSNAWITPRQNIIRSLWLMRREKMRNFKKLPPIHDEGKMNECFENGDLQLDELAEYPEMDELSIGEPEGVPGPSKRKNFSPVNYHFLSESDDTDSMHSLEFKPGKVTFSNKHEAFYVSSEGIESSSDDESFEQARPEPPVKPKRFSKSKVVPAENLGFGLLQNKTEGTVNELIKKFTAPAEQSLCPTIPKKREKVAKLKRVKGHVNKLVEYFASYGGYSPDEEDTDSSDIDIFFEEIIEPPDDFQTSKASPNDNQQIPDSFELQPEVSMNQEDENSLMNEHFRDIMLKFMRNLLMLPAEEMNEFLEQIDDMSDKLNEEEKKRFKSFVIYKKRGRCCSIQ